MNPDHISSASPTLPSRTYPDVPPWIAIESGPLGQVRAYYVAAVFKAKARIGQGAFECPKDPPDDRSHRCIGSPPPLDRVDYRHRFPPSLPEPDQQIHHDQVESFVLALDSEPELRSLRNEKCGKKLERGSDRGGSRKSDRETRIGRELQSTGTRNSTSGKDNSKLPRRIFPKLSSSQYVS